MAPNTNSTGASSLAAVTTVVHLAAPNDRDGNPRRAFIAFAGSTLRGAWPEGYSGCSAVPAEILPLAQQAPRINVSAAELRSWLKAAASLRAESSATS